MGKSGGADGTQEELGNEGGGNKERGRGWQVEERERVM